MAGSGNTQQKTFSRILLGAVVLVLTGGMLLYLVPSMPGNGGDAPAGAASDEQSQVPGGHGDHLPRAKPIAAPRWTIGRSRSTEAPLPTDRAETSDLRMATIRQIRLCLNRSLPLLRGRP